MEGKEGEGRSMGRREGQGEKGGEEGEGREEGERATPSDADLQPEGCRDPLSAS